MEDRDSDADNSDTGSGGPVTVDVGDPFADFVHNEFVPGSISDTKSPVSQRCKRKPKKASSIPSRRSETRPRKRSHPDPSSVQQNEIYIPPICGDGLDIKDSVTVNDPFEKFMETQLVLDYGEHSNPGRQPFKKIHLSPPGLSVSPFDTTLSMLDEDSHLHDTRDSDAESTSDLSIPIPPIAIDDDRMEDFNDYEQCKEQVMLNGGSKDPLYPGANISKFQAISMLMSWFTLHPGISKSAFDRLLYLLHTHILPTGNNLPQTYKEIQKCLQNLLTPTEVYHCCVNDCLIFRDSGTKKYAHLNHCPKCNEPRFKDGSTTIPRKRFIHLPLESRIRRLFSQPATAQLLQQHLKDGEGSSAACHDQINNVSSIHETSTWKEWYGHRRFHDGDKRALSFGFCTDGVNPFAKEKASYSMWPIVLFPLNLPAHTRKLSSSMMMVGIIPSPKEVQSIDPYLEIVTDDIASLNGIKMYDAYDKCDFELKASLLLHVLDYPGQGKVFHSQGAGAYAGCAYCCQQGEYCQALSKMVYLGHRRFLPSNDPLRLDATNFPHKVVCDDDAPELKTQKYVDDSNEEYAKKDTAKARTEYARSTGCTGRSALRSLPHHDRLLNTPVEPMHLVKCISEHVVKLVSGVEDSVKVRSEEKNRMRFVSTWPTQVQVGATTKTVLPAAPFRLSKPEMKVANRRAVSIRTPHGTDWKPQILFGDKVHLKSVQWKHVVASGILKYCIRGVLGNFQRKTLFELSDVLFELVAEQVDMSLIDVLEYRTHRVLALLERDFPVSLQVIVFHLLHHLPSYVKRFGPAYTFWMYPLERFNSWIARRVHNRRYPESTVIETYRLFEFTSFLSLANLLPKDSFADIDTVIDDDTVEDDLGDSVKMQLSGEKFESLKHFYLQSQTSSSDTVPSTSEGNVQNNITTKNYIVKTDKYGRQVRYQPYSSLSKHSSCIVYMRTATTNQVIFGEVMSLFKHKFNADIYSLACVRWFEKFEKDPSSKLIVVDTSKLSSQNPITSINTLSKPLIHAYDEEEESKLWVLNAPLCI